MEKWYVRNTLGKVFGPIDLDTLKAWVKEGRLEPLAGVSQDLKSWMLAPLKPELEMNWVVENNPGQFYGPTHRSVVEDLVKTGSLSREARFYQDDRGAGQERLRQYEMAVAARDAEISRRDIALMEAQKQQAKRDLAIANAQKAIAKRDDRIAEGVAALAQKDAQIDALTRALKTKEGELAKAMGDLSRKNAELAKAAQDLLASQGEAQDLRDQMAARDAIHEREWKTDVIEPEVVVAEMPPPVARRAFGFGLAQVPRMPGAGTASSLADLERRAQEEIARMGPAAMQKMFGKR